MIGPFGVEISKKFTTGPTTKNKKHSKEIVTGKNKFPKHSNEKTKKAMRESIYK